MITTKSGINLKPISPKHIKVVVDLIMFLSKIGIKHNLGIDQYIVWYCQRHS